jgi:hypothetical protein
MRVTASAATASSEARLRSSSMVSRKSERPSA